MKIYINIKSAGKRRPILEKIPYTISDDIRNVRDLLTDIVQTEVEEYNRKGQDVQLISFLTQEETQQQAQAGKVAFGRIYSDRKADPDRAMANALRCYEDGLVRVVLNEEELEGLDSPVMIQEEDCLTFIRLIFLAGGFW